MKNNRRKFINQSSKAGLILYLAPFFAACKSKTDSATIEKVKNEMVKQFDFATSGTESFTINNVAGNVWTFEERGGTIGFYVDEEGICVIDTQFEEQSNHLIEEIRKSTDRKFDYLINTHHHGDHTSGNPAYKDIIENSIAHENSIKNQKNSAQQKGNMDAQFFPQTSFDKLWTANVGNEKIQMKYYGPGHTDGDSVTTFINSNVVHMGDLVFNRRFPYIDKSAGANIESWVNVLDGVLKDHNIETKYIFGHSDNGFPITGTSDDLKAFQNYLENLLEFGRKSIKEGKTLEQLKNETDIIPGAEEWKGDGISRSLEAVYQELS